MKTLKAYAFAFLVVTFLCLDGWGCGWPPPPQHYSISSDFSPEQRETIRGVFTDWCDAVGYCPAEAMLFSERGHVKLVGTLPEDAYTRRHCPEGATCITSGTNNDGDRILVARDRPFPDDLAALWFVVAHEVGHYCLEHLDSGLMAATAADGLVYEIDQKAIDSWKLSCP